MNTWLGAFGVLVLVAGCDRRHDADISRSGTDTIVRSSTVKDTTIVRADTSVDLDTVGKTSHIPAGAADSVTDAKGSRALDWVRQPPGLPVGGRLAVVSGDPSKPGPFTIRVDLPNGYLVPPHWHPTSERIRVLEGTMLMGEGRTWSDKGLRPLAPGHLATVAARQPHYVKAKGRTIAEIRSTGPFEINYVNPADDPRKAPIQ